MSCCDIKYGAARNDSSILDQRLGDRAEHLSNDFAVRLPERRRTSRWHPTVLPEVNSVRIALHCETDSRAGAESDPQVNLRPLIVEGDNRAGDHRLRLRRT